MKKSYLIMAAIASLAFVSCSNEEFSGELDPGIYGQKAREISFGTATKGLTRSDLTGADAAAKLGNNFVVEGVKSNGTINGTAENLVFDHYNVNFQESSANTTTSNTAGWEYVAQEKHAHAGIATQSIKYWDYLLSQYDFIAYSKGTLANNAIYTGTPSTGQVLMSKIDFSKLNGVKTNNEITDGAYTLTGDAAGLSEVYIADLVTAYREANPSDYQKTVQFKFRSLSAKVRIALYETVPGYSVKDVVFYTDRNTAATDSKAHLFTEGTDVFNSAGKYIVYFPTTGSSNQSKTDYNKAHLKFVPNQTGGSTNSLDLGSLDANQYVIKQVKETADANPEPKSYIGRTSAEATYAGVATDNHYTIVLPNEEGAALNLKVNYTLVSIDGSGEEINVTGATAQVPAKFAAWTSGYAYTYLFKISQNGDGFTNPNVGPAGLYPITFDAVVINSEVDGIQETITTVAEPSITTYAKGEMVTDNNEYLTGANIYVVVENTPALSTTSGSENAFLYTVTLETGAAQEINEASVANVLKNITPSGDTWTDTDINGKKMIITKTSLLNAVTEIDADDSPTGNAITINGAKFTPTAAGTYVFEYKKAAVAAEYEAYTTVETIAAQTKYYTKEGNTYTEHTTGDVAIQVSTADTYYKQTKAAEDAANYYKIIKVVAPPQP